MTEGLLPDRAVRSPEPQAFDMGFGA